MTDEHRKTHYKPRTAPLEFNYKLKKYRRDIYSQHGENGVIDRLLERLKIKKGWCCELGAWDGKKWSNTYHLIERGWSGVYIENDPKKFPGLIDTWREHPRNLYIYYDTVKDQLDHILARTPIPQDFDVASIDTDTYDYEIWENLKTYRPKIVIMEDGDQFCERIELGKQKGYEVVLYTMNLIFVADEYTSEI
jgi:hypothetical protein